MDGGLAPQLPQPGLQPEPQIIDVPDVQTTPQAFFLNGERLLRQFKLWEEHKADEIELSKECWRYYHGDQWSKEHKDVLRRRKQPPTVYNEVRRKVNGFVGVEEAMRRDPKAYPRNPNPRAEKESEIATKSLRFIADNNNFESTQAKVALRGGVGGVSGVEFDIAMRYDEPVIKVKPLPILGFFYDPRSEAEDFSDAKFMGMRRWVDIDDAKDMMPEKAEILDAILDRCKPGEGHIHDEAKKVEVWASFKKQSVCLIEHWYKNRGVWHQAIHCGGEILKEAVSPFRDDEGKTAHRYELWSPLVDESGNRYGIVKDMIPIQDAINQRSSKLLHMLNTRQTMAEKGAVDDVDEMRHQLHRQDGHVEINSGMQFDIIPQGDQVSGQMGLLQHDMVQMDRFGPNNALIGRGTEQQSGVAIKEQKASGVAELSPELQELRNWKWRCYRKMWNAAQTFWTSQKFIRVTDDLGAAEFIHLNRVIIDPLSGQFSVENRLQDMDVDIVLDEGPDTVTMQQEDFRTIMELAPFLQSAGQPIPAKAVFKASPLRNKAEIIQVLEEEEAKATQSGVREAQQREIMLKLRELESKIAETESKTELNRSRAIKELQRADKLDGEDYLDSVPLAPIPPEPGFYQ